MYRLYGVFNLGYGCDDGVRPVADFTDEWLVMEYIRDSMLSRPVNGFPYRQCSMLSVFHGSYYEFLELTELPVNPKVDR
jgi:hypothetical protein